MTLVKEEDGGEYEVKAENEIGSVSTKSTVTVHSEYNNIIDYTQNVSRDSEKKI